MVAKFVESINLTSHAQNIWKKKKKNYCEQWDSLDLWDSLCPVKD